MTPDALRRGQPTSLPPPAGDPAGRRDGPAGRNRLAAVNIADDLQNTAGLSVSSLVGGIFTDAQVLLKQEVALIKREITDELDKAREAAFTLSIGLAVAAIGCLLLALMLVHLLYSVAPGRLPLWGCFGIVGAALTLLGAGLFSLGKSRAGKIHMPEQLSPR